MEHKENILIGDYRYDDGLRIRKNGLRPCLTRKVGTSSLSSNPLIFKGFKVKEGTKKGYKIANVGDSINLERPTSITRRGRVGNELVNTITRNPTLAVVTPNYKIRKITSREAWRLMGFSDEEYNKACKVCSESQLYKQAGNSIVVNVMEEIFKKLL